MDDQTRKLWSQQKISGHNWCLWRTCQRHRAGCMERRKFMAPVLGKPGVYHSQHREPWCQCTPWTRMAQMYLWRSRNLCQWRSGKRHPRLGTSILFHWHRTYRYHRLEWRRQPDAEQYVPLSRCFPHRYCHCFCGRPASVWHGLSRTLYEYSSK